MGIFDKAKELFRADYVDPAEEFLGETVLINGKKIKIDKIEGMKFKPKFFEINDKYEISIIRFYKQMFKVSDKDLSEDQMKAFEEMELHAEKSKPPELKKDFQ